LSKDDKILDVGCGAGTMLYSLKENGFDRVLGLDPFLEDTIHYSNGLTLLKMPIDELKDSDFDLIMLNNSFEHMDDPAGVLNSVRRLLASDGTIIINIPTVSSLAWETYKEKWIILGAPQHFYLHSIESMEYLAEKCGLILARTIYSSSAHHSTLPQEQFINRNILPFGKRSYKTSFLNYILNIHRVIQCQKIAEELNVKNQGERCLFVLKRK
jgi:ubiquinone/menaquinone biosynthesis C-methylase UbiE